MEIVMVYVVLGLVALVLCAFIAGTIISTDDNIDEPKPMASKRQVFVNTQRSEKGSGVYEKPREVVIVNQKEDKGMSFGMIVVASLILALGVVGALSVVIK